MRTRLTDKFSLRLAIRFLTMPALVAGAAGVCRVNQHDGYAVNSGLVADKCPQLIESPIGMFSPLGLAQPFLIFPHILGNTRKVFQNDSRLSAFCLQYKGLGYAVIRIFLKFGLFAGEFFETTFCRLLLDMMKLETNL